MLKTISITVTGKVQGVWYRKFAQQKAEELNIKGTAENLSNGDVHIIATGNESHLNLLISYCKQGPPRAEVSNVLINNLPVTHFDNFSIIRHLF